MALLIEFIIIIVLKALYIVSLLKIANAKFLKSGFFINKTIYVRSG